MLKRFTTIKKGFSSLEVVVVTAILLVSAVFFMQSIKQDGQNVIDDVSNQMNQITQNVGNSDQGDNSLPSNPNEETWTAEKKCTYYGGTYTSGSCQCPQESELRNGWCVKTMGSQPDYETMRTVCLTSNNTWDEGKKECIYDAKEKCIYPYEWNGLTCGYINSDDLLGAYNVTIVEGADGNYAVTGPKADVQYTATIPSTFKGKPITQISGFTGRKDLQTIIFEEGSTFVPDNFCKGCSALSTLTLPDSVEQIGSYAFADTIALKSFPTPTSLTTLGSYALSNSGIQDLTLNPMMQLSNNALASLSLNSLTVPKADILESTHLTGTTFKSLIIGKDTTQINALTFKQKGITSLQMDRGVQTIGVSAFEGNQLGTVTIPDTVKTIQTNAFKNSAITSLALPTGSLNIGETAFMTNTISTLIVPSETTLEKGAFQNAGIKNLVLEEGLTEIAESAFQGNDLGALKLPNSVTTVGISAFQSAGITSISSQSSSLVLQADSFKNNTIANTPLPNNITRIEAGALSNNQITNLDLGSNVSFLGDSSFAGNSLTRVTYHSRFNLDDVSSTAFDTNLAPSFYFETTELKGNVSGDTKAEGVSRYSDRSTCTLTITSGTAVHWRWKWQIATYKYTASISGWGTSHSKDGSGTDYALLTET